MGDKLIMSKKERQRKVILEQVQSGQLSRRDASKRLKLSDRQLIRILKRYIEEGDEGLIHRSLAVGLQAWLTLRHLRNKC